MMSLSLMVTLAGLFAPGAFGSEAQYSEKIYDCGEVNVFYTGMPAYHPYVIQQGWDPVKVDLGIRNDTLNMVKAGYNVKVVLAGPEQSLDVLREEMGSEDYWHATGVGYGVRPARIPEVVTRFEDLIQLFKEEAPEARMAFNNGPDSFLWSLERRFPVKTDCADRPGKFLGYEVYFDNGYRGLSLEDGLEPLSLNSKAHLVPAMEKQEL